MSGGLSTDATGIAWLQVADGEGKLDATILADIRAALREARRQPPGCLVLTGGADAFCVAGDDGAQGDGRPGARALREGMHALIEAMLDLDTPVVAAIEGPARGPGLALALAADLRVAGRGARFGAGALVGDDLGVAYGISWLLPRTVGRGVAASILIGGAELDADRALAYGLVDEIVADGQARARAGELATAVGRRAPEALAAAKRALRRSPELTLGEALDYESWLYDTAAAAAAREVVAG